MKSPLIAWGDSLPQKLFEAALHTSACVFGGRDMNELYAASASVGMSEADLKQYPLSGGLFKVTAGVAEMRTFEFG